MSSLLVTCWDDENFRCQVFLWLRVKYCQVFLGYCQVFLGLCAMWWNSANVTFSFELMGCDDSEAVKFSCDFVRHLDCQTVQLGVTWVKWWHAKQSWGLMCWSDQQECQVFLWLAVIERDEKNFKFLYSLYYIHTLYWCSDRWEFQNCLQLWAKLWDDRNVSNSFLRVCVIDWYGENIQFFNTTLHLRCPMHYKVLVHDAEGGLGLQLYEIELFHKFHTQERKCTLFAFKGAQ